MKLTVDMKCLVQSVLTASKIIKTFLKSLMVSGIQTLWWEKVAADLTEFKRKTLHVFKIIFLNTLKCYHWAKLQKFKKDLFVQKGSISVL